MQQFLKKEKLITIANIIDRDDIESKSNDTINFKFDTHKINIVSVGRLQPYKGFDNAIHALKILIQKQNHNVHLYIVGEGPERTNLEQLIIKNNLKNQCTLLGLIENPYPYMKNCDIYLQTSRFEGLGRTIIEASILNKPIVCTDFPTAFSILEHEKTGLIVPMQPEAIATAIQKLINDVDFSKSLTQNLENQKNNSKQKTLEDVKALLESN
jgi:glycosyltransferase involved in cell wall biosynthesis